MAFEYLAAYTTFDSVADMDKSVEDHIATHYYDLTESERAIVIALSQRSLMYPGASHLKAETIADQVGVSTKTVYRSIKKLVELSVVEKVAQSKLNGIKGASIYRILPFENECPIEVSERETVDEASYDEVSNDFSENQASSFNLLKDFKTSTLQEIYNNAHDEKEVCKEYMNEYQVMLLDFMHSLPLADNLKDELHKVVLAAQVQSTSDFIKAKNVLFKIAMDIKEGVLTVASTLRAVFIGAYSKAVERLDKKSINLSSIEKTENIERPVPFYNWLNERDGLPQGINNRRALDNWLLW